MAIIAVAHIPIIRMFDSEHLSANILTLPQTNITVCSDTIFLIFLSLKPDEARQG